MQKEDTIKDREDTQKSNQKRKVVIQSQPQLQQGVNLLQKPGKLPVFQSLVSTELEGKNATAVWIDSKNESSTYALSSSGSKTIMEKVHIGRAFTPLQHHRLIHQLEEFLREDTKVLVLPNVDFHYLDGQLKEWAAKELFQEVWKKILEIRDEYNLKVLISLSSGTSGLSYPVLGDVDNRIKIEATQEGWKYDSDEFEQYAYRDGGEFQTTVSYWHQKTSKRVEVSAEAV